MAAKKKPKKKKSAVKKTSNPRITKSNKPKKTSKKRAKVLKLSKKQEARLKKRRAALAAKKKKLAAEHKAFMRRAEKMSRHELIIELEKAREEARNERLRNEAYEMIQENWVPYYDQEQLHLGRKGHQAYPRGSIALQPSRARTLPAVLIAAILKRMRDAYKVSEDALDEVVYDVSDATGFSIREIYTLWYSP